MSGSLRMENAKEVLAMRITKNSLIFLSLVTCSAHAGDFKLVKTCGSSKVVSGNSCSEARVEFNLKGCDSHFETEQAKRIICVGDKIKAR